MIISAWEVIKRQIAILLHGNLTLAPSLWADCELQKYHYHLYCHRRLGSNPSFYRISFIARPFGSLGALTIRLDLSVIQDKVLDEWVFNFQRTCDWNLSSHLSNGTQKSLLYEKTFQFF